MATGYTYKVITGEITKFEDFALNCARAFGACISMRDEPEDKEIPKHFEYDTKWHERNLSEYTEKLKKLLSMSAKEIIEASEQFYKEKLISAKCTYNRYRQENLYCKNMLNEVNAWKPPTEEHVKFKEFMIQQLTISMNKIEFNPPKKLEPKEWYQEQIEKMEWHINYNKEEIQKEINRVDKRNKWIKELRNSLKKGK